MSLSRSLLAVVILVLSSLAMSVVSDARIDTVPPAVSHSFEAPSSSHFGFQTGSIFSSSTISSGDGFSCGLNESGSIECWGSRAAVDASASFSDERIARQVSSFSSHSCAILGDGSVLCWELSSQGFTIPLDQGMVAVALAVGSDESCSILSDASVVCWDNSLGSPYAIELGGKGAVAVSSGGNGSCAILQDQQVYCWIQSSSPQILDIGGMGAVAISLGDDHGCALLVDGGLKCWGSDSFGQTSIESTASSVTSLVAGGHHTCVLSSNSSLSCSGLDTSGQSSLTISDSETPVALSAGSEHTCVVLEDGSIICAGLSQTSLVTSLSDRDTDGDGVLNIFDVHMPGYAGDSVGSSSPIAMGMKHTCAVMSNRSLNCWGYNMHGQLGLGLGSWAEVNDPRYVDFGFDSEVWSVAADGHQTCAIMVNGSLWCWGLNSQGQLGIGTTEKMYTPQPVDLGPDRYATAVTIGNSHTCAITNDSAILCWGWNNFGQLGTNSSSSSELSPQEVPLSQGLVPISLAAGNAHTCSVMSNGSLWCWGLNNFGQNGLGQSVSSSSYPQYVPFPDESVVITAVANRHQTCAIIENRSLFCWGDDEYGQLGLGNVGSGQQQYSPQYVDLGGLEVLSFSGGDRHSCAILEDYTMWCWGQNSDGQLGLGNNTHQGSPIQIPVDVNGSVVVMTGGTGHSCAILDDGTLKCWGSNEWGQLGVGNRTDLTTPQPVYDSVNLTFHRGDLDPDGDGIPYHSDTYPRNPARSVECSLGEYGVHHCRLADPGHWVNRTGALAQSQCSPGTWQPESGSTGCLQTDPGNHTASAGMSIQIPCSSGTYQPLSGQQVCIPADPGHYVNLTGSTVQHPCLEGTYQPLIASSSCIEAQVGHFANGTRLIAQTPCLSGEWQPNPGSVACILTDPGNYTGSSGMAAQITCENGTYQNLSGQSACYSADPGHFVDHFGATSQSVCPAGTYQPSQASTSCIDAGEGYFVSQSGQTEQTACLIGTYQANPRRSSCVDASPGNYVPVPGSSSQMRCSPGTYQPLSGASSCLESTPGHFVAGNGQTEQTPCPSGEDQTLSGQVSCVSTFELQIYLIGGGVGMVGILLITLAVLWFRNRHPERGARRSVKVDIRQFEVTRWIDDDEDDDDDPTDAMFRENG
ncbi:MAG: hypothetical protein CL992_02785 [Euryarchaeota archaeon]|nr:hypothetical protein [Euryarchaeota archaeon]